MASEINRPRAVHSRKYGTLNTDYAYTYSNFLLCVNIIILSLPRNQVWEILAAIAVLRRLQQWLRYLLRLLRLRRHAERDDAWDEVSLQQESALRLAHAGRTEPVGNTRWASLKASVIELSFLTFCTGGCISFFDRVWPAIMFFAIVFGGPWLLWKLLSAVGKFI